MGIYQDSVKHRQYYQITSAMLDLEIALLMLPYREFCLLGLLYSLNIMIDSLIVRIMLINVKLRGNLSTLSSFELALFQPPRAPRTIGITSTALISPNPGMSLGVRTLYFRTFSSAARLKTSGWL